MRVQSLRHWIESHNGHLPKRGDKLPCGFGIGSWLCRQVTQLKGQRLEGVQISALDDVAPGWRSDIALSPESLHKRPSATELEREKRFTLSLGEAVALVDELGRFPALNSMGTQFDRVANWLTLQRRRESCGRLSVERAQRLDHTLPGWRRNNQSDELEQQWQNALAAFIARVKELGRPPSEPDPSAKWMFHQRKLRKQGRLHEGRERCLNEAVPGWNKRASRRESERRIDESESTGLPDVSKQAAI